MEPRCDCCGTGKAFIYCKCDSAKLCLNCDVSVHSANPLSLRHTRSLVCEKCFSQPALIHCLDEKASLCQGCHWSASSCSRLGHRFENLKPYSGCPSPSDFAKLWSSILEPSDDWDGLSTSSLTQSQNLKDHSSFFSMGSNLLKRCTGLDLCEGVNLDDAPLNFNANDDIIGCSSVDLTKCDQYEDSYKEDINIGFTSLLLPAFSGNVVSSLSLSNATDYQDCGVSPELLIGDSPWESNVEVSYSPKSRDEAKKRYNQKKSKRMFGKQIRYASRKARADTRKRAKGRFVKIGETVEYDPSLVM